jgi:hypothetical protein
MQILWLHLGQDLFLSQLHHLIIAATAATAAAAVSQVGHTLGLGQ